MIPGYRFVEDRSFQVPAVASVVFTWAKVTTPGDRSISS